MFAECGIEVYETLGAVYVENKEASYHRGRNGRLLRLREGVEQLNKQFYAIHEILDRLSRTWD